MIELRKILRTQEKDAFAYLVKRPIVEDQCLIIFEKG